MTWLGGRRRNTWIMLAVAIVACAVAPLKPVWLDTVVLTGILALISLSAGLSFGQAGILSMAQGAFAAIGAYATAVCTTRLGRRIASYSKQVLLPVESTTEAMVPLALTMRTSAAPSAKSMRRGMPWRQDLQLVIASPL